MGSNSLQIPPSSSDRERGHLEPPPSAQHPALLPHRTVQQTAFLPSSKPFFARALHLFHLIIAGGEIRLRGVRAYRTSLMRASAIADGNFAEELSALGEQLASGNEHSGASVFRVVVEGSPRAIRPVVRDEIYGIAREALRNAYGHAHARTIEAEISYGERLLRVRIRDDGIGIKETHLGETGRAGHYGLRGMRERATRIGASLEVWSEEGAGTEIELRVPYRIAYKADGQDK